MKGWKEPWKVRVMLTIWKWLLSDEGKAMEVRCVLVISGVWRSGKEWYRGILWVAMGEWNRGVLWVALYNFTAVSYTHLTLPTIYSV